MNGGQYLGNADDSSGITRRCPDNRPEAQLDIQISASGATREKRADDLSELPNRDMGNLGSDG